MNFNKFSNSSNETFENGFEIDLSANDSVENIKTEEPKPSALRELLGWIEIFVTAIIAVVLIFTLCFRIATVDGESMQNTLLHGEKIVISNLFYTPKAGDIVVVSRNVENSAETATESEGPIVKRIIATGGQTVDIDFTEGIVYVDGAPLDEPYISTATDDKYDVDFPVYVPEGYIFVMGDNRGNSMDSRDSRIGENGLIDERYILGRAIFRLAPLNRAGRLDTK